MLPSCSPKEAGHYNVLFLMAGRDECRYERENVLSRYPEQASAMAAALHEHLATLPLRP